MPKTALLFPGQGAQIVGMGKDIYDEYPRAKDLFHRASEVVDFDLLKLCFSGPQEELSETQYSQPAILTTSMAFLEVARYETKVESTRPVATAGLSRGE